MNNLAKNSWCIYKFKNLQQVCLTNFIHFKRIFIEILVFSWFLTEEHHPDKAEGVPGHSLFMIS